jgi:hypothetical protein
MIQTDSGPVWRFRTLPKDIGVALFVLVALGLGLLLRLSVEGRTVTFQEPDSPFRMAYPAGWGNVSPPEGALLYAENPLTPSPFKAAITVERRELDPSQPAPLDLLVDRRVEEYGTRSNFAFFDRRELTVGGQPATEVEYAYVTQPILGPQRAALPVVVHAREVIVSAGGRVYYITLDSPAEFFETASGQFDTILNTVQLQ